MDNQMSGDGRKSRSKPQGTERGFVHRDDFVLIPGIVILFIVVVLNYTIDFNLPPIIVSVLLATAIAILVFRFLGGIGPETRFSVGALKFSGSLGALIGSAYLFNLYLPEQTQRTLHELFSPHYQEWIPLNRKSGVPVRVSISGIEERLEIPEESPFRHLQLSIGMGGIVMPEFAPNFPLGVLNESDLQVLEHTHHITQDIQDFVVTDRLPALSGPYDLDPIPFQLVTKRYAGDYSRYSILDRSGKALHEGRIKRRGAEVLSLGDAFILVAVVEVKHDASTPNGNYAKFAVGEITLDSILEFPQPSASRALDMWRNNAFLVVKGAKMPSERLSVDLHPKVIH